MYLRLLEGNLNQMLVKVFLSKGIPFKIVTILDPICGHFKIVISKGHITSCFTILN